MARIHLIYPDIDTGFVPGVNHGLASLAGAVRQQGHNFSFNHIISLESIESVIQQAKNHHPDIIGFSYNSTQKQFAIQYGAAIKEAMGVTLIAGGVHPTIAPEEVLNTEVFSGVALGEAEKSLPDLLTRFDQGDDLATTPGFWWKRPAGDIYQNPVPPLEPLANLPMPDYSIFDTASIQVASSGWIALIITRGCPYNCSYCCNHVLRGIYPIKKDYVRFPYVEHGIRLIKNGLSNYSNVHGIEFSDDLLISNRSWFLKFAESYKKEIGLPYMCNGRIEHFSDDIIRALKDSYCTRVNIGIESGNEWLRRFLLNRHMSNQTIIDCFDRLKQAKIQTSAYNMVGLPFETKDQMRDTLDINKLVRPDHGGAFYFYPFPATKLYNICKEYDLLLDDSITPRGYVARMMIKEIHCTRADCERIFQRIRLFYNFRIWASKLGLPDIFSKVIYWAADFSPAIFMNLVTKASWLKKIISKCFLSISGRHKY